MSELDKLDILDGMDGSDLVQETFLFKQLTFDETTRLAGAFQKRTYPSGTRIIEENAIGDALYIIRRGSVEIRKTDGENERCIAELSEGELFGEMSLVESSLTSASVVAKDDVECLVLPRKELDAMMGSAPVFAAKVYKAFCHILSERLRKTSNELLQLQRSR